MPCGMHPPFSFPLAEKRMRRARWKRKGAVSKLAAERKFGEYGSQLFCSKTCFPLRGTGGVRRASGPVRRADSPIKPRGANRTPFSPVSAAARPRDLHIPRFCLRQKLSHTPLHLPVPSRFASANRGASSNPPRFIRPRRRFGGFHCSSFFPPQTLRWFAAGALLLFVEPGSA